MDTEGTRRKKGLIKMTVAVIEYSTVRSTAYSPGNLRWSAVMTWLCEKEFPSGWQATWGQYCWLSCDLRGEEAGQVRRCELD